MRHQPGGLHSFLSQVALLTLTLLVPQLLPLGSPVQGWLPKGVLRNSICPHSHSHPQLNINNSLANAQPGLTPGIPVNRKYF